MDTYNNLLTPNLRNMFRSGYKCPHPSCGYEETYFTDWEFLNTKGEWESTLAVECPLCGLIFFPENLEK